MGNFVTSISQPDPTSDRQESNTRLPYYKRPLPSFTGIVSIPCFKLVEILRSILGRPNHISQLENVNIHKAELSCFFISKAYCMYLGGVSHFGSGPDDDKQCDHSPAPRCNHGPALTSDARLENSLLDVITVPH